MALQDKNYLLSSNFPSGKTFCLVKLPKGSSWSKMDTRERIKFILDVSVRYGMFENKRKVLFSGFEADHLGEIFNLKIGKRVTAIECVQIELPKMKSYGSYTDSLHLRPNNMYEFNGSSLLYFIRKPVIGEVRNQISVTLEVAQVIPISEGEILISKSKSSGEGASDFLYQYGDMDPVGPFSRNIPDENGENLIKIDLYDGYERYNRSQPRSYIDVLTQAIKHLGRPVEFWVDDQKVLPEMEGEFPWGAANSARIYYKLLQKEELSQTEKTAQPELDIVTS